MHKHDFSMRILIAGPLCIVIMALVFILNIGNPAALNINSFAVDTSGLVYVGGSDGISVYQDGNMVRTFDPPTSRGYLFTIQEKDTLMLFAGRRMYTMDLQGNILEAIDYADASVKDIPSSNRTFVSSNGDEYKLKSFIGIPRVIKNGNEVVYQAPTGSVVAALIGGAAALVFVALVIWELVDAFRDLVIS